MTIRVYTVASDGTVTSDRGTRTVPFEAADLELGSKYPPCECPRHRLAGVQ
ncbi:hypothetical protein [Streptomyces sp. NPDC020951]|uniref:hypothetical protein n=1 Tax=Streptomyces sp. NPDC020951 TaxID=3365104 RepID=UPI0037B1B08F